MNPNFSPPQADPNSSSLAYLNHLPPGTQPHYLPVGGNPPRLGNRPASGPSPFNLQPNLMSADTGQYTSNPAQDASLDDESSRGLKRNRTDASNVDLLEHSEPVWKRPRKHFPETQEKKETDGTPYVRVPAPCANLNNPNCPFIMVPKWDFNAPWFRTAFLEDAIKGNLANVKSAVEQGCDIRQTDEEGTTALMHAAENGHVDIVEYLVDIGCDYYATYGAPFDAFMLAAMNGHLDVVKCLTEKGYMIRRKTPSLRCTALMLAASNGHLEIVKYLYQKGCGLHEKNFYEKTALMYATQKGHLNIVKYIVNNYGDPDEKNFASTSSFIYAASKGRLDILKFFVDYGSDIHQKDGLGDTAIMIAARSGHLDIVEYLIDKGGNINQINNSGGNVLADVVLTGDNNLVEALIKLGATPDNNRAKTAQLLFAALKKYDPRLVSLLIPIHDVSKRDNRGQTPLMLAAEKNLIEVAVPLIQATLKLPTALQLAEEAAEIATGSFFRELLRNPFIVSDEGSKLNSTLQVDSEPFIVSAFISEHVLSQYDKLQHLRASLGSDQSITPMQIKSAKVSVLAELTAWKLHHSDENLFTEDLPSSLGSVKETVIAFISEDVKVLATQALQWEEDHLIPVVENLYEGCLRHSLLAQPTVDITSELNAKGLYHPITQRISAAWTSAWATVATEAIPMLRNSATHIDDWDKEDLADLDPITGEMAINPDTITRKIESFKDTPVSSSLLQAFRTALRREFDSVGSGILRAEGANLSEQSKALYADLIGRQLHLIAQFWRAES